MVQEICNALRTGVDISFRGSRAAGRTPNMRSALDNPEVIRATIHKELESGWSIGPFATPPFPDFVINSIGVVPQKSGGFRMITDLSRPEGAGINHAINEASRLPITIPILQLLHQYLAGSPFNLFDQHCLWSCCALAFFGCFRIGELLPTPAGNNI